MANHVTDAMRAPWITWAKRAIQMDGMVCTNREDVIAEIVAHFGCSRGCAQHATTKAILAARAAIVRERNR